MQNAHFYKPELQNVSETLLVPLFSKAKETMEQGLIKDYATVEIIRKIEIRILSNGTTVLSGLWFSALSRWIQSSINENKLNKTTI
ncbi:MAG: hypothetical protein LBH58_02580 [Tannerellaceae bacterium]|jgi:O-methyltransferase involved in polyketide biosynthesis|nr:hypothetical protein [Tannerellaceae bacterium]